MLNLSRRSLLRGGVTAVALQPAMMSLARAAEPERDVTYAQDFDELWTTLANRYCYFADKRTDWAKVRATYRPLALAASDDDAFRDVVRRVLSELYDAHTHLSDPPDGTPRWPLYDILAERDGAAVRIVAVKEESAAAGARLSPGDRITAIDGQPIEAAVLAAMPRCLTRPDPAADCHAINVAVAGRRGRARTLGVVSSGGGARTVALPLSSAAPSPPLEWRRLQGGLGYIAIRSFAEAEVCAAFDRALAALRDAPGLVIDVRRNGGGDTAVARPIMGRFLHEARPYALMRRRDGEGLSGFWTETVEPRGPFTYDGPVVVLVDHWSASMAEGFAMGMRGIGRARVVGTPMMGLGAAVFQVRLDRSGIQAQYSGEPVFDVQRRPRDAMRPDVEVRSGGDILAAGLTTLAAA